MCTMCTPNRGALKMTKRGDTSVAINYERKSKLQDAAVDITIATRKEMRISTLVHHLIDNYLDDAKKDLKAKLKENL